MPVGSHAAGAAVLAYNDQAGTALHAARLRLVRPMTERQQHVVESDIPTSLHGQAGWAALQRLLDLPRDHNLIDAHALRRIDAYGAAALRAAIEARRRAHGSEPMRLQEPADSDPRSLLAAYLAWPDGPRATRISVKPFDPRVILPAVVIEDGEGLLLARGYVRVPLAAFRDQRVWQALDHAIEVFGDNAFKYARGSALVLCAGTDRRRRSIRLVAIDLGRTIAGAADSESALREALRHSKEDDGGLTALGRQVCGTLNLCVRIVAGRAQAEFRDGDWHYSRSPVVPGFLAALEIRR